MTEDSSTMGTTGTPGRSGADAANDDTNANASDHGPASPAGDGGELDRPGLPFDRSPGPDDPIHRAPSEAQ